MQCSLIDKPLTTKESGEARIEAEARTSLHLSVLLMLAWYVLKMRREEAYHGATGTGHYL